MCKAVNEYGIAECTAELYIQGISDYTSSEGDGDSIIEYLSLSSPTTSNAVR